MAQPVSFSMMQRIKHWIKMKRLVFNHFGIWSRKAPMLTDFEILHQSKHYVVGNKQAFVRMYQTQKDTEAIQDKVTLASQFRHCLPECIDTSTPHGVRFVHRLDYATSGAVLMALDTYSAWKAKEAFTKRRVTKHYIALVRGHVTAKERVQEITIGMGTNGRSQTSMEWRRRITEDQPHCWNTQSAHTNLVLLEHGLYERKPASKVLLIPVTGRTHQLRVHCSYIGHHIVGDYVYSAGQEVTPPRLMLHARRLHVPMTGESINVTTPDPFTPDKDPKWKPTRVVTSYEEVGPLFTAKGIERTKTKRAKRNGLSQTIPHGLI